MEEISLRRKEGRKILPPMREMKNSPKGMDEGFLHQWEDPFAYKKRMKDPSVERKNDDPFKGKKKILNHEDWKSFKGRAKIEEIRTGRLFSKGAPVGTTTPSPKRQLPRVHRSERPHLAQRDNFQRCIGPNDHT
ncbi:uncharacterized protein G2W53_004677 [Senna tora]|uniref:Uncharacterized protein n=1 Tax=Senna tora TaxID=362788 RepID=A0A834XCA2_9FABA|nr:uncharacterized protein G2W53_004677 [Senna tora]